MNEGGCARAVVRTGAAGLVLLGLSMLGTPARADDSLTDVEQVTIYAPQHGGTPLLGGASITQVDMQRFERDTLDQALLLASGTAVSTVGPRNETDIWLRGFDRWRVPLYQDGIPIYLPYDNRIDFGRFTTIDLSQVQVSKGFASVIDGPGAMGGSVNLVSRVVQQPLEAEARYGARVDSTGRYEGELADFFAGTRQTGWFAQVAGSFSHLDDSRLSDDFMPGTFQGAGERVSSQHQDYKINLKAGYDPAPGQEYSVNFIDQVGEKGNPPPDGVIPQSALNMARFWTWPRWDKQSAYWLSQNALDGEGSYLKTRIYYDRFYNVLDSFDNITYSTMSSPKAFVSTYDDRAAGASVELAEVLAGGADTVRVSGHFRWDQHNETEVTRNAPGAPQYQEPWETAQESTSSVALENIYRPAHDWQLITGVSYDFRHLMGDSEWVTSGVTPPFGSSFAYPVADKHALNGEAAAIYDYSQSGSVHLSYADRTRFPTLFEMYSTRFSSFQNNPDLQPERSHYAQVGVADTFWGMHTVVNLFYARIDDAITSVVLPSSQSQSQNTGGERQQGYEIELSRPLSTQLSAGVNWSSLTRVEQPGIHATDTPDHRLFAYLDFHPSPQLSFTPSVDLEGPRWLQGAVVSTLYYRSGSYAVASFRASYQASEQLSVDMGITNMLDRNYLIEDGYHSAGREYFADVRVRL